MMTEPKVTLMVDGVPVNAGTLTASIEYPAGFGTRLVEFKLTPEGFIGDGFNENDDEPFKTQAFTFDEWCEAL